MRFKSFDAELHVVVNIELPQTLPRTALYLTLRTSRAQVVRLFFLERKRFKTELNKTPKANNRTRPRLRIKK